MDNKAQPIPDDAPRMADARALFENTPSIPPAPTPVSRVEPLSNETYGIEGGVDVEPETVARPPILPSAPLPRPEPERERERTSRPQRPTLEPSEAVGEVWSRGAEWGGTIVALAVASLGLFALLFLLLSHEQYGFAFFTLLGGGVVLMVLSYPLLITLERPVRMTPEQAARDFFSSLSHHAPHYRRMWLLLSNAGRVSGKYASFEGFRAYWKSLLGELKTRGNASRTTPLKFQVTEFRSEKSGGKLVVDATYNVEVFVRGRSKDGAIASFPVSATFAKGPDNMWYLDQGTLP